MNRNLICHKSNMNTWSYCTNTELDAHSSFSEIPTIFVLSAICLASHSSSRQSQKHLQKRCLHSHMFGFTQHTSHIGYNSQFTSTKCTILGEVKNRRHPWALQWSICCWHDVHDATAWTSYVNNQKHKVLKKGTDDDISCPWMLVIKYA
jgi:hypothetical protein